MNRGMIKTTAAAKQRKTEKKEKIVKKAQNEKPYTMQIHESLERIREGKLSDISLFELSIRDNMSIEVFRELKRRIELIRNHLNINLETAKLKVIKSSQAAALEIVNNLLESPQETYRRLRS